MKFYPEGSQIHDYSILSFGDYRIDEKISNIAKRGKAAPQVIETLSEALQ